LRRAVSVSVLSFLALAVCGCTSLRSPRTQERFDANDRLVEKTVLDRNGALLRRETYRYPSSDITVVNTHIPGESGAWKEIEAYHLHETSLTYLLTRYYDATGGLINTTSALDTPPDFKRKNVRIVPPPE
jgi:hypothetical protein